MHSFRGFTILMLEEVHFYTRAGLATALALQAVELLSLKKAYSQHGPWAWALVRQDFLSCPKLLRCLDFINSGAAFTGMIALQILLCFFLLAAPNIAAIVALILIQLLIASRFRGAFNGGSDAMTVVLLTGLAIAALSPRFLHAGLLYIAVFATFSYVAAGISKIKNKSWWSGAALKSYVLDSNYDVPALLKKTFRTPWASFVLSWSLLFFELSLPLCFATGRGISVWLAAALLFHLVTFAAIGLNRFFWVWISTYPALYFFYSR